ncbi:hypothetical protein GQ53DRAFT_832137 [Thozetella sp. PMI_491]|nr:hypothetical protein GQ53DRAFT_832137 [Thozetella sp. PMI_491]
MSEGVDRPTDDAAKSPRQAETSPHPPRSRRTKTGCQHCRRRKVRCDEQKPSCRACCRLRLDCAFPAEPNSSRPPRFNVRFAEPAGLFERQLNAPPDASSYDFHLYSADQLAALGDASISDESPAGTAISVTADEPPDASGIEQMVPGEFQDHNVPTQPGLLDIFDDLWDIMDHTGDVEFEFPTSLDLLHPTIGHIDTIRGGASLQDSQITDPTRPVTEARQNDESAGDASRRFVEIRAADHAPLEHFLNTMIKFSKMKNSRQENVYISIFSTLALSHQQLFQAMMAWSSLHLAQSSHKPTDDAEERYARANELLMEDRRPLDHIDATITTIWFLLQYECLRAEGIDIFCSLLHRAASLLRSLFDECDKDQAIARLGPMGIRGIVWMSAYDARASTFGNAGHLLGCLRSCPYVYDLIDGSLRLRMVMGQIKLVKLWPDNEAKQQGWDAVDASLRVLRQELDNRHFPETQMTMRIALGETDAMPDVSSGQYNGVMLLATFYTAVILYQEYRPPTASLAVDEFLPSSECALRVIRLVNRVHMARPDSPQGVWRHIIFVAGMVCRDPIYQIWAVRTLQGAEVWGNNFLKTRVLLETIIERQNRSGKREDFVQVMQETTGLFVI